MKKQAFGISVLLFALLGGASHHAATPGTFQQVGDMTTPRVNPTATRLNDGTVLVTGGWKQIVETTHIVSQETAERFDPQTNTFSAVGSMTFPRADHTAVRLQDGRVLVVGGSSDDFPNGTSPVEHGSKWVATAEIFDPATGKFSTVGDLITPRVKAAATLLPNGKVLVMGGLALTKPYVLQSAELFDPATGKFTATGPMTAPRNNLAAVPLPDGRVVIMGGLPGLIEGEPIANSAPQRSVEIYDPSANTFSPAGQMVEGRAFLQATLLPDGRILVTGGANTWSAMDQADKVSNSVEIYDPATGQSTVTDHLAGPRFGHAAVALADGRVLVVGGASDANTNIGTAELIDPVTGKVSPTGSMAGPRRNAIPALLPDGRVLVIGGRSKLPFAEVYVP